MSLLAMQRDMRAWLVHEDEAAGARLGPGSGLSVYLNNYRSQLVACLTESFPCTRAWIGGDGFEAAAASHIDRVPPSSWTLDAYPRDFPATLALLWPDDPEIAELAWIESALEEAFVGPDSPRLRPGDIARIDWDQAILRFTPTLEIGRLVGNSPEIWSALAAGEAPPAFERLAVPGAILVWRRDQISSFRTIDPLEHQALLWARSGMKFSRLCEALVATSGEAEGIACAGRWFGQWIADGLVACVEERPV